MSLVSNALCIVMLGGVTWLYFATTHGLLKESAICATAIYVLRRRHQNTSDNWAEVIPIWRRPSLIRINLIRHRYSEPKRAA